MREILEVLFDATLAHNLEFHYIQFWIIFLNPHHTTSKISHHHQIMAWPFHMGFSFIRFFPNFRSGSSRGPSLPLINDIPKQCLWFLPFFTFHVFHLSVHVRFTPIIQRVFSKVPHWRNKLLMLSSILSKIETLFLQMIGFLRSRTRGTDDDTIKIRRYISFFNLRYNAVKTY